MEIVIQVLTGVVGTIVATVLTAVILHRLRLNKDGTPFPTTAPSPRFDPVAGTRATVETEIENEPSGGGRREETMKVLFRHGVIKPGDEIEPMPEALPRGSVATDTLVFHVRIGDPSGRAVVWAVDGATYSLTKLSNKLSDEHGLQWFKKRTFELWRLVGQKKSLWDTAEELVQQESQAA